MAYDVSLVADVQVALGEGPCWDEDRELLFWVDILGSSLHMYDPKSQTDRAIDVGQPIGAAVLRKSGGLVLALKDGFYALEFDDKSCHVGHLTPICEVEKDLAYNRMNDGKVDFAGRFWAGTMAMDEHADAGSLYVLDTNREVRKVLHPVTVSNGLAWSLDHQVMYYIDSPKMTVVAYDYDLATGNLANPRVVVRIPDGQGVPDGMAIDEEGMLWIAQWGGWRVSRYDPRTGELLDVIPVPAAHTSSCAFGGKNLDELYITTARDRIAAHDLPKQPHAGSLFRVKMGVRGLPSARYMG